MFSEMYIFLHFRTPRDMAKGSVKKFFERLYETESSDRGKNVRHSFMRALRRLFFCASPMKAVKTPPPKRPRSWSPQYDGRENFLSEEEKRLRCAFRKNQAVGFGSEPPIVASVGQPLSPVGKSVMNWRGNSCTFVFSAFKQDGNSETFGHFFYYLFI